MLRYAWGLVREWILVGKWFEYSGKMLLAWHAGVRRFNFSTTAPTSCAFQSLFFPTWLKLRSEASISLSFELCYTSL